jgi:hypothetical protein
MEKEAAHGAVSRRDEWRLPVRDPNAHNIGILLTEMNSDAEIEEGYGCSSVTVYEFTHRSTQLPLRQLMCLGSALGRAG